jgi:elongation factor Ts
VALQVASMNPMTVAPEDIPREALEEERSIAEKQAAQMGKPENITHRIVEGRLEKWVRENALLTQPFVKDPEKTVGDLLRDNIQKVGENIVVRRFVRYEL